MKVDGKVCVVTGGGSGIGAALARGLCERGAAAVVLADINAAAADAAARVLARDFAERKDGGWGTEVRGQRCDVSQEEEVKALCDGVRKEFGRLDVFAANAGITGGIGIGLDDTPTGVWDRMMKVNTMHAVWAARYSVPHMAAHGGGGFIITASAAGLLSQIGSLPYAVSKHAAVAVAEWLAFSHRADNISVTCLCPQAVDTPMIAALKKHGGGVAGIDGILSAQDVATQCLDCFEGGDFLCLPHESVKKYMVAKASDPERWIHGMARLHERTGGGLYASRSGKARKKTSAGDVAKL